MRPESQIVNPNRHYRVPEDAGFGGLAPLALLVLTLAAVLGAVYGAVSMHLSNLLLNIALALGCGGVVGVVLGKLTRTFKVPGRKIGGSLAVLAGGVMVYAAWVAWMYELFIRMFLVLSPIEIFEFMRVAMEEGTRTYGGRTLTDVVLVLVWTAEAGLLAVPVWLLHRRAIARPFCAACGQWANEEWFMPRLSCPGDPRELAERLEAEDYGVFDALTPIARVRQPHLKLTLSRCSRCRSLNVLTAVAVACAVDETGAAHFTDREICAGLMVNEDGLTRLQALKSRWDEFVAAEDAAESFDDDESVEEE